MFSNYDVQGYTNSLCEDPGIAIWMVGVCSFAKMQTIAQHELEKWGRQFSADILEQD